MAFVIRPEGGLDVVRHLVSIASSLYGSPGRYKCMSEEGFSVHLNCVAFILQNIDIEHPVGHMINDVVQNHHATYGCGTKTLLMVLDMLAVAALKLKHQGLDEMTIVDGLRQVMELSIEHLPTLPLSAFFSTDVHSLTDSPNPTAPAAVKAECVELDDWLDAFQGCRRLATSRDNLSCSEDTAAEIPYMFQLNEGKAGTSFDEDDVGWFFENGIVPKDDEIEQPMQDLLKRVDHVLDSIDPGEVIPCNLSDTLNNTSGHQRTENIPLKKDTQPLHSSGDGAEDTDLDSCPYIPIINNVKSLHSSSEGLAGKSTMRTEKCPEKFEIGAMRYEKSVAPFGESVLKFKVNSMTPEKNTQRDDRDVVNDEKNIMMDEQNSAMTDGSGVVDDEKSAMIDSDDEFGECFEGVNYNDTDQGWKRTQYGYPCLSSAAALQEILQNGQNTYFSENKGRLGEANGKKQGAKRTIDDQRNEKALIEHEFEEVSGMHREDDPCATEEQKQDLDAKLDEMLKRKTKSLTSIIPNQSRHFKTIQSTVEAMKCGDPGDNMEPVNKCERKETKTQELNAKVEAMIKSKSAIRKGVVLNRSRNYRDINSALSELASGNSLSAGMVGLVNECSRTANNDAQATNQDIVRKSIEDTLKENQKSTTDCKLKVYMSTLQQGSKHFKAPNASVVDSPKADDNDRDEQTGASAAVDKLSPSVSNQRPSLTTIVELTKQASSNTITHRTGATRSVTVSRHLCEESELFGTQLVPSFVTEKTLECFVKALSHGEEMVGKMVSEAAWRQRPKCITAKGWVPLDEFSFDPSRMNTVTCPGVGSQRSEVVQGLVVPATLDVLELLGKLTRRRTLLINGDVTPNFQHRGVNNKPATVLISRRPAVMSRERKWLQGITESLDKMSVTAVVVKGAVDPMVVDYCHARNIVLLSRVNTHVLMALAESTQADMVTYVTECTEENIAHDVVFKAWCPDWSDQITCLNHTAYALVTTSENIVQTVVVCHPCGDIAAATGEKFWHIAHRLRLALSCGKIVAGGSEPLVATRLYHTARKLLVESFNPTSGSGSCDLLPIVVEAVADGFRSLGSVLQFNTTGQSTASPTINGTVTTITPSEETGSAETGRTRVDLQNYPGVCCQQTACYHQGACYNQGAGDACYQRVSETSLLGSDTEHQQALPVTSHSAYGFGSMSSGGVKVVDDYTSKVEAYRSAVQLVCQILLTDYEVVTGLLHARPPPGSGVVGMI